ncbi:MAG: hypothetical protein JJE22_04565, partial [Bacteroidia bacterium]|nr:hypothetical protein [Bacteroidia bacterium]
SKSSAATKLEKGLSTTASLIPKTEKGNVFYAADNYVSIEANHFTKAVNTNSITWKILPDLGKTGSAITPLPVTAAVQKPGGNAPNVQYEMYFKGQDSVKINTYFSPTLNFHNDEGLQYGISIDDETPQIISINKDDNNNRIWEKWVANSIIIKTTTHPISGKDKHVLKFWMVNPGVVLQKIVVNVQGTEPASYLGPPETRMNNESANVTQPKQVVKNK